MSSSLRPKTLRSRLIFGQIVVLVVLTVVTGVVAVFALHEFLTKDLDRQIEDLVQSPVGARAPGINAMIVDGEVKGTIELPRKKMRVMNAQETAALTGLSPGAHSVDMGAEGHFRVNVDQSRIKGLPSGPVDEVVWRMIWLMVALTAAGVAAAALVGRRIIRRSLVPLDRVADTATRVSELPLHQGDVALAERVPDTDPDTEVGKVGLAFNRMLGHVGDALKARHDSETRVRRFVADASHELRTPLAAIRGYAELTRRSEEDVSPQIAHAMSRVESEAVRMTSLVEDMLLLARLDDGRPLDREEVDLTKLVLDVVGDARISAPGHSWRIAVPPDPVTVQGDVQRLHQVLGNLLSNARTHTPPGTTVTTGLTVHNGRIDLTVTDDGPGIPEGLEVFERFARGDSSRSRAAGSTGLGLSIVAAVVGAHDGEVSVQSVPGKTTFTVSLRAG
ncbi:sensor histidine kinase [Lentzea rhizosphaerae]|uniref:histidine kinase n=1 Tax=Lentzea rhizosphaerae TaxID=2041025 RepID=A0ABV8C1N3_9PSEU